MRKRTKFLLLRASIIMAFLILAGRVWYVQVVMGSYYKQQGDTSKIRIESVAAPRGIIYDRFGRQLVYNAPSWSIEIVPHGIPPASAQRIYTQLAALLHNDPSAAKIASLVHDAFSHPYTPAVIKQGVSSDVAMIVKQLHFQLPGVRADPIAVRRYPNVGDSQVSLSHILGYTGSLSPEAYVKDRRLYPVERVYQNDQAGRAGIELLLDPYLHGVNGSQQVEVDAGERPIRVLRRVPAVPGNSVYLTVDSHLQAQVANDLYAGLQQLGVRQGAAVVENVRTGEVLAMVSLPSFNNNWFVPRIGVKRFKALNDDPATPLTDLATQGQFPPGSTYKIITATAGLESGVINAATTIEDNGVIDLFGQKFYGWLASGLGPMNVVSALARSSDIFFYTVAGGNPNLSPDPPHTGPGILARFARLFGLGSPTGVDLPYEAPGNIPDWRQYGSAWHIGDTYNMAIGQGYNLATPLQMANVTATVANGGTLLRPRLVERIVGRVNPRLGSRPTSSIIQPFVPQVIHSHVVSPDNLALIQRGMHESVNTGINYGTSYEVGDPRIDAAGKTGTAEVLGKAPDAWWVGYAPFNNPQVAVCVLVPYADSEGATAAAPIAHKIFEDYFHLKAKPNWVSDVTHFLVGSGTQ